jgi:transcriptional regulator with XRE-family HTH domain
MRRTSGLGEYLRARRELVRPQDVGLANGSRRRVPGLRREELATLAGISADYYLRLEQGRDLHPSPEVIAALARALRLDDDAATHLSRLAHSATGRRGREQPERAPASIEQLIASWPSTPAYVMGRLTNVLAANTIASALLPALRPGVNLVRAFFLDPDVRRFVGDSWEDAAALLVARLHTLAGPHVEDPALAELVDELSQQSDRFRQLWARHDIQVTTSPLRTFNHPLVGRLELQLEVLGISGADGQLLMVYHAAPGSPSARALSRLAATPKRIRPRRRRR